MQCRSRSKTRACSCFFEPEQVHAYEQALSERLRLTHILGLEFLRATWILNPALNNAMQRCSCSGLPWSIQGHACC